MCWLIYMPPAPASVNFIATHSPKDTTVHGFDSFEWLPERWRDDRDGGFFDRSGELPPVEANVRLHAGWFEDTLPVFLCRSAAAAEASYEAVGAAATNAASVSAADTSAAAAAAAATLHVAFLHIDCDLYSSTKTVLTQLAPAIRAGSVIVFDEYCGYDGWEEHEARAWREFCTEVGVGFEWIEPPAVGSKAEAASRGGLNAAGVTGEGGPGPSKAVVVTGRSVK